MLIRQGYKYKMTQLNGEQIIIYYNEDGTELTREAYTPTPNNFSKMNAEELAKVKTEMDSEYSFLTARTEELDVEYDNLMARQTELLNE